MFVLKAVTVIVAGLLTARLVKHLMGELEAAKARVRVRPAKSVTPVARPGKPTRPSTTGSTKTPAGAASADDLSRNPYR